MGHIGIFKRQGISVIKNLVVNGCSFSEIAKFPNTASWSQVVADWLGVDYYKNIAMGAAGNRYIAHSTIDLLEHENLNPTETLVLIMWSGISRKDIRMSKEWWEYVQNRGYPYGAQFVLGQYPNEEYTYWMFSGGGPQVYNSTVSEFFEHRYKISDETIMCRESLEYFNLLAQYLEKRNYQYRFMSFVNYWNADYWNKDSRIFKIGEYALNYYCSNNPMYKNFDFSKWIFIDDEKNSLGEYAWSTNQYDITNHPTDSAHQEYAEKFVIPKLKQELFK